MTSDGADWYDELEEIGPGDPEGDDLVLTPRKVAALATVSNEAVMDSNPQVLDTIGMSMTRAIWLEADNALFTGGGTLAPSGVLNHPPTLQNVSGSVSYENIVRAGGGISAYGGVPTSVSVHPTNYVQLQLATGGDDRPLIQPDANQGGAATVAGYRIWQTPAVGAGTALVAQADQIVVALRSDATVTFSNEVKFAEEATVARVIARIDGGVNDHRGLCTTHT